MAAYEAPGETDEWHTPRYIFDALGVRFDLDVASPDGSGPVLEDDHLDPRYDLKHRPVRYVRADLYTPIETSD